MHQVYVLESLSKEGQIYIGYSSIDLQVRLQRHNLGSTPATKRYRPWKLAWSSAFMTKKRAMELEAYLKTGSGRAFLRKRLL